MKLKPLASDSMGVRAMAFSVATKDVKIVIDPSVRLGPIRFGLPPHPEELVMEKTLHKIVMDEAKKADILTISHYHYDHHEPELPEICKGKTMLIKHPEDNINKSQISRSKDFLKLIDGIPKAIEYADGRTFDFGNTGLRFSDAVAHGTNTKLGCVIQIAVSEGEKIFLHTSDVEGPSRDDQLAFIIENQPHVIACDGPMTYLMYKYGTKAMENSLANLKKIISETPVKDLMLDHHLTRDGKWREKLAGVIEFGKEQGCRVQTFAEFAGGEDNLLEARRKLLHKEKPVE